MSEGKNNSSPGSFKDWMRRGLKRIVSLTLGDSDMVAKKHQKGDLPFDKDFMEILEIDIDQDNLPKPKVFKLNLVVTSFFNRLKKNIREVHALYMVCSDEVVMQYDTFDPAWEERLIKVLNEEYELDLQKIHLIRESDILNLFNGSSIKDRLAPGVGLLKRAYNLSSHEFLLIAGGFINFKYEDAPLLRDLKGAVTNYKSQETIATIEVEFFNLAENLRSESIRAVADYPVKYRKNAGAYFYVGGEWYHNIFLPELFNKRGSRYICFRIDDDGKYIRFFPDTNKRHIPICVKKPVKEYGPGYVRLTYTINPDYISIEKIMDFKISIVYESDEVHEVEEMPEARQALEETSIETLNFEKINQQIQTLDKALSADQAQSETEGTYPEIDQALFPYLATRMLLLPRPRPGKEDISSYLMKIEGDSHTMEFSASSVMGQVSIYSPDGDQKPYVKKLAEPFHFTTQLAGHAYTFSSDLISKIQDDELKLYFSWTLESTQEESRTLDGEYYLLGRDPAQVPADRIIHMGQREEDFWRIGTSRNHAFLVRGDQGYALYNLSSTNSVYIVSSKAWNQPIVRPKKMPPVSVSGGADPWGHFFTSLRAGDLSAALKHLRTVSKPEALRSNDRIIIGNRIFEYVVPAVVESQLRGDAEDQLRTILIRKTQQIHPGTEQKPEK